jgi:1-acyl-sn-glycerol-3-phosphate acyltransferase
MKNETHPSQFALLGQRRFAPFFWTQFFGAANDNILKFAFTVLVTYQMNVSWMRPEQAGLIISAVFILPFLLFSATSGQLADKYDKATMMRLIKWFEIVIMVVAAWGFVAGQVALLLGCLFLMGVHSTLFGPVKYAYLPQHLDEHEITGGNGMVEMGTFVAILLGQLAGGLLVSIPGQGPELAAIACLVVAIVGRAAAQGIPPTPAEAKDLRINWNPISETLGNLRLAAADVVVFRSLLGISWMWFFGATFLSQFPAFAKDILHGDAHVASLLLVLFSVGVGVGSLLCERLSRRQVEIGLVPLGAIGMSVFAIDLYFAVAHLPAPVGTAWGATDFALQPRHLRLMADLFLLSLSAGLYSVPMYALIQTRAPASHRARIIAANNILNAAFMIASSVIAGALLLLGVSIPGVLLLTGIANAIVAGYIFHLVPEYLLRFVAFMLTRVAYRFRIRGAEHIPATGPAIVVCNHVSFVDPVLLMAASPRPIRFLMDASIFRLPVLGWVFRRGKAIPIAPKNEDPQAYDEAFAAADQVLAEGDLLGIFPEGGITKDGELHAFKGGIMRILERRPVPVVPLALHNLWGSFFSRIEGAAMSKPFRRGLWNPVTLTAAPALAPAEVSPENLHARVDAMLRETTSRAATRSASGA